MPTHHRRSRVAAAGRLAWTLATFLAVELVVCALGVAPVVTAWFALSASLPASFAARAAVVSLLVVPSYIAFALTLLVVSPLVVRACGWRSPASVTTRLADLEWTLLTWARYCAALHVVRVIAGTWFRGTPLWTLHLRLSGATLGRRVYVNSLAVSDYNLLEFGDDVVIGGAVQISGHTVEAGLLKTAPVRLGDGVTVGLGSVIEIDVVIGARAQIGALSFVPKHSRLDGGVTYVGAPVVPLSDLTRST